MTIEQPTRRKLLAQRPSKPTPKKNTPKNQAAVITSLQNALDRCNHEAGRSLPIKAKANMAALKAHHASFVDEQQNRAIENSKGWKNIRADQKHVRKEEALEEKQHAKRNEITDKKAEEREAAHIEALNDLQATIDYYRGVRNAGAPPSGLNSFRSSAGDVASLNNAVPSLQSRIDELNQDGGDRNK